MTIPKHDFAWVLALSTTILLASCGGGGGGGGATTPIALSETWLIPVIEVVDGGPGKDGIPSIDTPVFQPVADNTVMLPSDIVVGVFHEGVYQAYPHEILNWHEVVNDSIQSNSFVLSYCPLTGSALAWDIDDGSGNPEFGVSGLLYNSNLILYDRDTNSRWSQMLELAVWGPRIQEVPVRIHVIETSWETWIAMYPDSWVLTRNTGHQRNYNLYPYGNYFQDEQLLFPVSNRDNRLHPKERVIGIRSATASKVYQLAGFGAVTQTINEQFDGQPIVVIGNSVGNFAAIFSRELLDGTVLTFSPLEAQFPSVMQDNEGTTWDLFGTAISGPRVGTQLALTSSYTAMWFAWATFFDNTEIHFN